MHHKIPIEPEGYSLAIATVCSRAYLAQALTMLSSIDETSDNCIYNVFLTDLTSKERQWLEDLFPSVEFYFLDEFADQKILDNILLLTDLEFNTSLKPVALEIVVKRFNLKTFYCDSDLLFLAPPGEAVCALDKCDVLLTPHQLGFVSHGSDFAMIRTGIFNSGFLGVSGLNGLYFIEWWKAKTENYCFLEPEDGIFVDQKWLDLAPALFEGVKIFRHSGYNLGHWNLEQKKIEDKFIVLHLSGFSLSKSPTASQSFSKYSDTKIPIHLQSVLRKYREAYEKNLLTLRSKYECMDRSQLLQISEIKIPVIKHRYLAVKYRFIVKNNTVVLEPKKSRKDFNFARLFRYETRALVITRKIGAILVGLGMAHLLEKLINIFRVLGRRNSWLG
jgi:hypothetical protein